MSKYYYISNISYNDNDTIINIVDQSNDTGVIIYNYNGLLKSKNINDINYCYIYKVYFYDDSIILNTKQSRNEFIVNKIKITNKVHIWTNYKLCYDILNNIQYFSDIPFNIDPSIIDINLINAMIMNNPMIIYNYKYDKRFWNDDMLFKAIYIRQKYSYSMVKFFNIPVHKNNIYSGITIFKSIPEQYKTEILCENVCSKYLKMLCHVPIKLKHIDFYKKVFISSIKKHEIKYDFTFIWNELPLDVELYQIYYDTFNEYYGYKPPIYDEIVDNMVDSHIDENIECVMWLIEKNPKILNHLPNHLYNDENIKKIINKNKLINKIINIFNFSSLLKI